MNNVSLQPPRQVSNATAYVVIALVVVGLVGFGFYVQATNNQGGQPFWQTQVQATRYTVQVRGTAGTAFAGTLGSGGESRSVQAAVPADFEVVGSRCVAVLQKTASGGTLEISIHRGIERLADQATSAPFGVVTVSAR